MQLALAMGGTTADGLERGMTHRELQQWTRYARDNLLPSRRIEIMIANACYKLAQVLGGNVTLDDFLVDFGPERAPEGEPDVEGAKAAFGFSPRKRKDDPS